MNKRTSVASLILASLLVGALAVPTDAATLVPRRLDGVPDAKSQQNKWPIAVMIDNHTAARPQAGLQQASIVYESLAEGGIPRFMAVYPHADIGLVGPVRSTRPYFVRYASEYGAAMAHAGGSPDGLKMVKDLKLLSLWGIKGAYAKYFYRIGSGVHSLYTNGTKLKAALKQAKYTWLKPTYRPWKFGPNASLSKRAKGKHGATIDLGYGRSYDIRYDYDRARNVYLRSTGGRAHIDKTTRKQLAVKNVIILIVPKEKILDKKGRLDLHTVGRDRGVLLQNGFAKPITWVKKSTRSRTIFYDQNKKEITLISGNTWITVVPRGHSYSLF